MNRRGIMRALVAGLLALIIGATAVLARSHADAAPGGQSAAEAYWQQACALPVQQGAASPPGDDPGDAQEPVAAGHLVRPRMATQIHARRRSVRQKARTSRPPARGPPGTAI